MSEANNKLNWPLVGFVIAGFIAIGVTAVFGGSLTHKNTEALIILATVFSVFAGFTIAIITVLGDPAILYSGSWRIASAHRRQLRRSLRRQAALLYVYLGVLGVTFAAALLSNIETEYPLARCFERAALSLGAGAFVWSLALPASIVKASIGRLDEEVDNRSQPGSSG